MTDAMIFALLLAFLLFGCGVGATREFYIWRIRQLKKQINGEPFSEREHYLKPFWASQRRQFERRRWN